MINGFDYHNLEAQKYWSFPKSQGKDIRTEARNMIFSNNYIGSRKMDGAFYKFVKNDDGTMELLGRSKSVSGDYLNKIGHVPQLHSFFNKLPCGTCLLGEIYFPNNEGSSNVTTIMGCLEAKAINRQGTGDKLHYYVFDVLAYNGIQFHIKTIEERVAQLVKIKEKFKNEPYVEFASYLKGSLLWDELEKIFDLGGEGIVITKCGTVYQPGKRPARQTLKVKKEISETLDVVIVGANPPTKEYNGKELETWQYWINTLTDEHIKGEKYQDYFMGKPIIPVTKAYWNNWAGSLRIGAAKDNKVVVIGSLSGLTEEVLANWQDYIGKVAEITAMEVLIKDGKFSGLRHPRFIRWRPDKNPKDCEYSQLISF